MTAIGVTNREGDYNRQTEAHDWKRRGERLVRASGLPYTIVRPGWFDYNKPDEHRLVFLQGDRRHAGDPSDGVIARRQIARGPGRQPDVRGRAAQELRTRRRARSGAARPRSRCSRRSRPTRRASSTPSTTSPTCRWPKEPQRVRDDLDAVRTRE